MEKGFKPKKTAVIYGNLKYVLLAGFVTALTSELYFSMLVDNFRVSASVIVFPILLMTVCRNTSVLPLAGGTFAVTLAFRYAVAALDGTAPAAAFPTVFPGAFFYLTYGVLFSLFIRNRYTATIYKVSIVAFFCDAASNMLELLLRYNLNASGVSGNLTKVLIVALVRGVLVYVMLLLNRSYHFLLKKGEHEVRYRQLFRLTADLKSELFLMQKNSEEIEDVMKSAYSLYEELQKQNGPENWQKESLAIASRVHDIKKDYYRVIRGIEEELGRSPNTDRMQVDDLFRILTETLRTDIARSGKDITVYTEIGYSFETTQHYALLSILMNLVTNAAEAFDSTGRHNRINVWEERLGEEAVFRVEDNGRGIPEKRLAHIFEMGYSTKFDEKTGNIYRGVGLCSVRQLAEDQLGGRITVESEPDKGSCFTLYLPMNRLTGE